LDALVADLERRLAREVARREHGDARVATLSTALREKERALAAVERDGAAARQELELVERHLAARARPQAEAVGEPLDLSGLTVLYVGGRAHQVPQLKGLIERAGARFLHHDGGVEHSAGLLPGLVGRADHALFPIDCVSHDAAATVKRLCGATGKRYH